MNNKQYLIHIVDDSKSIIMLLSNTLKEEGYEVAHSINGQEAIRDIQSTLPDLIILDVEMPVMDGYETIKQLKSDKNTATIPVIFHTTLNEPKIIQKIFKLGASDYISKPFIREELLARVAKEINSITLQNKLKEKMSKLAELLSIDSVTGASNRMHMTSLINSKMKILSKENRGSFSLMYIDFDSFNNFSRKIGIIETEKSLRQFSNILKKSIRDKDVISHWGSDIFVILLPQITDEQLNGIAIKIRDTLEKFSFSQNNKLTCTIAMLEISLKSNIIEIFKTLSQRILTGKKMKRGSIFMTDGRLLL
jgi:diguanylate cyclase (GGDEF)-like protein